MVLENFSSTDWIIIVFGGGAFIWLMVAVVYKNSFSPKGDKVRAPPVRYRGILRDERFGEGEVVGGRDFGDYMQLWVKTNAGDWIETYDKSEIKPMNIFQCITGHGRPRWQSLKGVRNNGEEYSQGIGGRETRAVSEKELRGYKEENRALRRVNELIARRQPERDSKLFRAGKEILQTTRLRDQEQE